MNKKKYLSAIACLFYFFSFGQLEVKLDQLLTRFPANTEVGISVTDDQGKSIYSKNANRNMIPASLQKIVTNFAALEVLGEDYQFTTQIGYNGDILPDGNLTGNIVIYGNGDPSLGSERYQKRPQVKQLIKDIVGFIRRKGITCIDGMIICDASYYGTDGTIHSWAWNDIGNYYACNTWSINIHENYYNLYFQLQNNRSNQPRVLSHSPYVPKLTFKNELTTGASNSGDQSYIFGAPYSYDRIIRGSLPSSSSTFKIKGAMPNSPEYLANLIAEQLNSDGVSNNGGRVEFDHKIEIKERLAQIKSPVLKELVKSANLESINLYCESFLVAMGKGSRNKGITIAKQFLNDNGIDTTNLYIDDGSGLSVWNNLSPNDFATLLNRMHKKYGAKLNTYFPEAGQSGTLSYLFKGMEANGKLWAKTGSMQQVMNYAGFTKAKSGRWLSFCIIANRHQISNRQIRKIHEEIMNTIYSDG